MKTHFFIRFQAILCLSLFEAMCVAAQQPEETLAPPQPPLIAPMPERLQWSVTVTSSTGEAHTASPDTSKTQVSSPWELKMINSTKTGIYKHAIETYQNGQTREFWFAGDMLLDTDRNSKNVMVVDYKSIQRAYSSNSRELQAMAGWSIFSWINLSTYKGGSHIGKEPCYHYVLMENNGNTAEAWISTQTRFPVAYRFGKKTYLFQYGGPPSDLQLPPEYAKAWGQYQRMIERAQRIIASGDR